MFNMEQDFTAKTIPLEHQAEAINYVAKNNITALFDEQGLGKTKIVIDALCISMSKQEIKGALIIAPLSLLYTWEQEVKKHSHLIPIILRGSKKEKKYKFLTGANFYITNYEAVIFELDRIKRFCKSRKIAIVLDEAARIKDPKTKTAKALFEIAPLAEKRIIVTGTPIANNPVDLWALYYFLDKGRLLGDDFNEFKARFDNKNSEYLDRLNDLKETITNNSIRRLKKDVLELPEKIIKNVYVELIDEQLDIYNNLRDKLIIEITETDGTVFTTEIDNILVKLLRLTQIASNPKLVDNSYSSIPVKFPILLDIIKDVISRREKVIIWTNYIENITSLRLLLNDFKPLVIYGEIPTSERFLCAEKFQNDEDYKILIANPSAAREGLTLTRANNAIYLDRNFNLVDYLQSQDRIHRISQDKQCIIYKLIAKNTIDEYIDKIIEMKTGIAKFIEGDKEFIDNESINTLYNKQYILQMLGGKL